MQSRKSAPKAKKTVLFSDDFYSDRLEEGMLYAVIVRSPFSIGKITRIALDENVSLPENYYLFTADDIPSHKTVVTFGTRTEILCSGEIKYRGEPVALLAGPDKKVLLNLRKNIKISLSSKSLFQAEKAFSQSVTFLTVSPYTGKEKEPFTEEKDRVKNSSFSFKKSTLLARREVSFGDTEKEFSNGENTVTEGEWNNSVIQHEIGEPSGCFCFQRGQNLHVFTPGRFITHLKDCVSRATGFENENIILTCTRQNDRNSNKIWRNGIFAAMAAIAAVKTGKPVLLCLSREEELKFIEFPIKVNAKYKTALSKKGILKAMDIQIQADTGFQNPLSGEILDRFVIAASGIYNIENLRIRAEIFSSNNPTSSIRLNRIDSQIFFALECQIQKVCEKAGFSPLEIKLKNLKNLKQTRLRARTVSNPFLMDLGRAEDSMKAVCALSDFNRKYTSYRLDEEGRIETNEMSPYSPPLRGIGLAAAFDGNGYLGTTFRNTAFNLQVTLTEEKKLFVHTSPPSQNIKEIWQNLILNAVGDIFDLDKRSIYFNFDKAEMENERGLAAIQNDLMIGNISIKTHLLKSCLTAIKNKKDSALPITVKKSISPAKRKQWNEDTFSGLPFFSTSFGSCVVEVEYDSCTYTQNVTGVYAVIDCGRVENPEAAETTAKQSIKKCLCALMKDGNTNCPNIVVKFAKSDDEPKNLDSLIYSVLPAAFCSAVSQAVAREVNFLPLKTDSLFTVKSGKGGLQ